MTHTTPALDAYGSCPTLQILYTEGDRLPEWFGVIEDIDLTGYTVKLNISRPSGVLTKTASLVDATNGQFKFSFDAGDLEDGVGQECLLRVIDASGRSETLARWRIDVGVDPEVSP